MVELIVSHTLELPDELYAALLEVADASGLSPQEERDRRREDES